MSAVHHFTDGNFSNEIEEYKGLVLVDFWASWCAPCRSIAPHIESLATEYANKAKFGKVNVDEEELTPQKFGIRALPTLVLFKNGQPVDQIVGAVSKDKIAQMIDKHI
mgnify:CR=1 FL=1